jgi:hypothetical protein
MKCIIKGKINSLNMKNEELIIEGDVKISDSYHELEELYAHRILLFVALMKCNKFISWKSKVHSDGTSIDGWFIAGMKISSGDITYHIPDKFWDLLEDINMLETAPEWDGHTSEDVIKRLNNWASVL